MNRSKKIFLAIATAFVVGTVIVGYDISRKTSFPGAKKHLKESIAPSKEEQPSDTVKSNETPQELELKQQK